MTHLIYGRVTHVEHYPYTAPHSVLTVECDAPYPHLVSVKLFWQPMINEGFSGEVFCNALAEPRRIVIAATMKDGELTAVRSDVFIPAPRSLA